MPGAKTMPDEAWLRDMLREYLEGAQARDIRELRAKTELIAERVAKLEAFQEREDHEEITDAQRRFVLGEHKDGSSGSSGSSSSRKSRYPSVFPRVIEFLFDKRVIAVVALAVGWLLRHLTLH